MLRTTRGQSLRLRASAAKYTPHMDTAVHHHHQHGKADSRDRKQAEEQALSPPTPCLAASGPSTTRPGAASRPRARKPWKRHVAQGPARYAMLKKLKCSSGSCPSTFRPQPEDPLDPVNPKEAQSHDRQLSYGTSRRSIPVARVRRDGTGEFVVNEPVDGFSVETAAWSFAGAGRSPTTPSDVRCHGQRARGGRVGRAGAVRHEITRALIDYDAHEAHAVEGRSRHARRARSGTQEDRPPQRRATQAVSPSARRTNATPAKAAFFVAFVLVGRQS